jgi:hypothetical protein
MGAAVICFGTGLTHSKASSVPSIRGDKLQECKYPDISYLHIHLYFEKRLIDEADPLFPEYGTSRVPFPAKFAGSLLISAFSALMNEGAERSPNRSRSHRSHSRSLHGTRQAHHPSTSGLARPLGATKSRTIAGDYMVAAGLHREGKLARMGR